VTVRAVLLGLVGVAVISFITPYSDLVMKGTWIGLTAFPISSFFLFTVLVLGFNAGLRRVGAGLSRQELLGVYGMLLVSAGIPSFGLTGLLIPYLAGPHYFATPENRYAETVLRWLPRWLLPQDLDAVTALYEGLAPGRPLPWDVWLPPLIGWSGLVFGLYLIFFGLGALLRKPWVDEEKLVFPLVHLPVEMCDYGEGHGAFPRFFRQPVVWLFFAGPFLIHALNGLHYYVPFLPSINVHRIDLGQYLLGRTWEAIKPFWLRVSFSIIGLTYLLPSDVSFSLWFFYFFFLIQQAIGGARGYTMPFVQAYPVRQFVAHQMIGGILIFGLYALWNARRHFGEAAAAAFLPRRRPDDAREPLSYRQAVWGLLVGFGLVLLWGDGAGAGFSATLIILLLFLVVHLVAVRLVCEGGMLYVQHPFRPFNLMLAASGSFGLGRERIPTLALLDHLFMLDNRSPLLPCLMQSFKAGDLAGLRQRRLTGALALSVLLAVPLSIWAYLRLMYAHGGLTLNPWFTTYYTNNLYCTWTAHLLTQGEPAKPTTFLTLLLGVGTMGGLLSLHRQFWWWPLHPVGYLMGASWPMINFWFPIFLGWLIKSLVLRYGGARIYRQMIPGFLALILAEFFSAGLWVVVDYFTGVTGHEIFSF